MIENNVVIDFVNKYNLTKGDFHLVSLEYIGNIERFKFKIENDNWFTYISYDKNGNIIENDNYIFQNKNYRKDGQPVVKPLKEFIKEYQL